MSSPFLLQLLTCYIKPQHVNFNTVCLEHGANIADELPLNTFRVFKFSWET